MKRFFIFLILTSFFLPNQAFCQNRGGLTTAAAIVGITALIGTGIYEYNQYVELLEHNAAEYYLSKYPSEKFKLSLVLREGAAFKDLSNVSVLNFIVEDYDLTQPESHPTKKLLSFFLSEGWANEYGIDFTRVIPKEWNKDEWTRFYLEYISVASGVSVTDATQIPAYSEVSYNEYDSFVGNKFTAPVDRGTHGVYLPFIHNLGYVGLGSNVVAMDLGLHKVLSDGRKVLFLPFSSGAEESLYLVKQFNDDFKIVYNEGNMGIFLTETSDLVEMKREWLNKITNFFYF